MAMKPRAPDGELSTFVRERKTYDRLTYDTYRKGRGPAVIIITEMPGISPHVLGFADRVAALGCSVVLPDLFGTAGRDPDKGPMLTQRLYALRSVVDVCIRREFTVFASDRHSPVVDSLRALAVDEHARAGGPGVGVVGMCFTGGFALAMATEPRVIAPVMSQPSLPMAVLPGQSKKRIDCTPRDLEIVAGRCARGDLSVLGLRFIDDPFVPEERFQLLRERLGDGFVAVELAQSAGHPDSSMKPHHSVLTRDLIDQPGEPTRDALDRVLSFLRSKLLAA